MRTAGVERQATILGRDVTLQAAGTVSADSGQLLIGPETVDLGGPSFLDSAASTLARSLCHDPPRRGRRAGGDVVEGFGAQSNGTDVVIGI